MNFNNYNDTMDSRDLEERLNELKEMDTLTDEEKEELQAIEELKNEVDGMGWEDGILFINENYFDDYAEEYIKEVTEIPSYLENYIDYKEFARDLSFDYTSVSFMEYDFYCQQA